MEGRVLNFSDYLINEELNFTRYDNGVCRLEDRWFYYNTEDDIIYGSDDKPVDDNILFSISPAACTVIINGDEKQYDVNNPVCLVTYDLESGELKIYTDDALTYLQEIGYKGDDIQSPNYRNQLMDIFEDDEDKRYLLLYGDQMIASSFDILEEN